MPIVPEVLREEPHFLLLWTGQTLSVLGDTINRVALAMAVTELSRSTPRP